MPPGRDDPADPRAWLRRARSNLARARVPPPTPEVLYEDLCFDAQQAAEKAIKAVLVHRAVSFPKTHDLNHLLSLAARNGIDIPPPIREADRLTRHAFESRYPGPWSVSAQDWVHAVALAEGVVRWAEALIVGAG